MPGQLSAVLERIAGWPAVRGLAYGWAIAPPEPAVARYLASVSAWTLVGLEMLPEDRARLAALWKQRPDLREVLGEAVGYTVCAELKRMFVRQILDGGRGDVARWVAAHPEVAQPLFQYFEARTRRFNHPLDVVDACAVLTRILGAPVEAWGAAAVALDADPRREREVGEGTPPFLSPELDTAGALTDAELWEVNGMLVGLGSVPLQGLALDAWWHPVPLARGDLLARAARASIAAAGERWSLSDLERYARALVALQPPERVRFAADSEALRRIRMRAIELR